MKVLPDTSVWIDFFRDRPPVAAQLDRALAEEEVVTCGPVVAELVAGTAPPQREVLSLAIGALRAVELDRGAWEQSGELARELRRRGAAVPLLDLLIGIAAVRADAALWTRDYDFERMRDVLPRLELYRP